ncbi:MAG TPA: sulfite reductase subunit alpha [Burkholderiaceae bacterium]|nr:sulfite reductase subunit alpha [Burkholderiaceae bacterium]
MTPLRQPDGRPAIKLLPDDAPFSAEQRAWLNGFFAGLLTRVGPRPAAQAPAIPAQLAIKVVYASQTGTAETLARKLAKEARGRGFAADSCDLASLSIDAVARLGQVLVIASTHGDGDAPDAAAAFATQLASAQGTPLAGLNYAVLALGDSSYARFCRFGQLIDERFAALGAVRLAERIDADTEVDGPFKTFRERLWPVLEAQVPAGAAAAPWPASAEASVEPERVEERWTRARPWAAELRSKVVLNGAQSDKEVRHIALSLKESNLTYEPGDALGVWPRQSPDLVQAIVSLTGFSPDAAVTVDGQQLALGEALATRRELTVLTPPTVIQLADLTKDAQLQALVQPDQSAALQQYLEGKDVADVLQSFPGVVADAQSLIRLLPPLKPRLYSISSSLAAFPDEVHLTVATVRYERAGRRRGGLASTWFADHLDTGHAVPVFVQRNPRFRLPADPGTPIVMIGPGTGIAPFRAFLHHRRSRGLTGRTWLFFGERHAQCDFLYRSELESFLHGQQLSRLDTAFSRDQREKIYVQHRMLEAGKELWAWLQDGAHLYVCGDASRMAKDVDAAIRSIIAQHGGRSAAQAQLDLHAWAAAGRYVRDVY